ncbi:MAG TPA: A24 family peptidase [Pseudonocardiaceae bacterium]|jgi:leader peptidase (prepilin peptidase)/N-methyltransferase
MGTVIAGTAGAAAGWSARAVLIRLRRPVRLPSAVPEAVLAALWALSAARNLPPWWLPVPAAVAWLAVVLTATDLRHRRLPDAVTVPAYPVTAVLLAVAGLAGPGPGLAARAAAGGALLLAVHAGVHLAAPRQLGAGDVKLAGPIGAVLGAVSWSALLAGPVLAAVVTAALAVALRGRTAPHGPGLLAAALLAALFPAAGALAG